MPIRLLPRLFLILFLSIFSALGLAAPEQTSIRVVLDDNYPPYIFRDSHGQFQGILKDLWVLWQERTGIAVDFQPMEWSKAQQAMINGQADVIDTLFKTDARKKIYDFSLPYARIEVPIFFHKSISGITNTDSLKGFTVGVKDGDACIDYLNAHGIDDLKRYPSYEAQVKAAIQQEIRVLCIDKPPATFFFNRENAADTFRFSPTLYSGEFHWAVIKDNDSLKWLVERGFARITVEERAEIEARWLGQKLTIPYRTQLARYGWYALMSIGLIIGTLLIWNWTLRRRVSAHTRELSAAIFSLNEQIRAQQRIKNMLIESESFQKVLIRAIPDLIWLKDSEGVFLACNHRFEQLCGAAEKDIIGKTDYDFSDRESADFYREHDRIAIEKNASSVNEEWVTFLVDGHQEYLETTKTPLRDTRGRLIGVLGIGHDITERKNHENQLRHIAHYDVLTALPNRILLSDRMSQGMAKAKRNRLLLVVTYLDLDGFKEVNDRHGHAAGDQLLIHLSRRMKNILRESDTLARLGGDEFVVVMNDLSELKDCLPMLDRLLVAASEPWQYNGHELRVSASLGITLYPQSDEVDADQLLRQADQAMYQAKLSGKNRYHIFDAEQDRSVRGRHESLDHIQHALMANEFVLYYQPKVNMRTGQVIGAEALIRWQHPERGLLAPAVFLPTVEEHPLAVAIGEWVIDTALQQMIQWRAQGLDIPVSVNVGAYQLQSLDFVDRLRDILSRHPDIRPHDLELEVLETSALEDMARVSNVIESCREIGILFSLDDFGTGYSSLTYLKRLAVSQLKIDQSFVRDMLDDPDDLAILGGVLSLATAFHRQVIAEGVETVEHGTMLLQLGCELAQGYGIARPMPAANIPAWVQSWQPAMAWRNQPTVSRSDLPLLMARVEHRAWIRTIEHFLLRTYNNQPLNRYQCGFGTWLDMEGQASHGQHASFLAIVQLHTQIHDLAEELCEMHAHGESARALARLNELHILRDALLAHLQTLLEARQT